jgi:hypothetical protein
MTKKKEQSKRFKVKLELSGMTGEDKRPDAAVYIMDRAFKPIEVNQVNTDGVFSMPEEIPDEAHRIVIGPIVEDLSTVARSSLIIHKVLEFQQLIAETKVFEVAKKYWCCWPMNKLCVSGSLSKCYQFPYPPHSNQFSIDSASAKSGTAKSSISLAGKTTALKKYEDAIYAYPDSRIRQPYFPRCSRACDGYVTVYRRNCCCQPFVIYDLRVLEIIAELERLVPEIPPRKWPPDPAPDPFEKRAFIKGGTVDEKMFNAAQDLHALRSLPAKEQVEYINARPYLFPLCPCTPATAVANGFIDGNGEFHICWWERLRLMYVNCHDEYAFVIKQSIDGEMVTIYDGLAASQWFRYGEEANLKTYDSRARACRHNEFPLSGTYTLLERIGDTDAYHLETPPATGWDRVDTPAYNSGLVFPAADSQNVGSGNNRNWGGTLPIYYHFSESMKTVGAKYYRLSVTRADGNGNPIAETRTYLQAPAWKYYEVDGSNVYQKTIALGPHQVGNEGHLYEIPFDADREWLDNQCHTLLNTTQFSNGPHLLTLEIFNGGGELLWPSGILCPDGITGVDFKYRRWYQKEDYQTSVVPYAALTHMFWWDNRKSVADILYTKVNNVPNEETCQFLVASGTSSFQVGYRAYHPEPMFMADHRLWWRRGFNGPVDFVPPHPNYDNVGKPSNPPHDSTAQTFAFMLGHPPNPSKCTFTMNLHTNVKTFNGTGTLNYLDSRDQDSFALEIT